MVTRGLGRQSGGSVGSVGFIQRALSLHLGWRKGSADAVGGSWRAK